jgi:hypothetical protein
MGPLICSVYTACDTVHLILISRWKLAARSSQLAARRSQLAARSSQYCHRLDQEQTAFVTFLHNVNAWKRGSAEAQNLVVLY